MSETVRRTGTRDGVVAVIARQDEFLVIRRSQYVAAPGKICFPGGGIHPGESEEVALRRELHEELALLSAIPVRRLWRNVTPFGVRLAWWLTELPDDSTPIPNPDEVETVFWEPARTLVARVDLLVSMRQFFAACRGGEIPTLPPGFPQIPDQEPIP